MELGAIALLEPSAELEATASLEPAASLELAASLEPAGWLVALGPVALLGSAGRLGLLEPTAPLAPIEPPAIKWASLAAALRSNLPAVAQAAETGLVGAARFLSQELKVPGERLLPYSHQMIMLIELFRNRKTLTAKQVEVVRHWFWATSYSGWFAGANTTQINDAVEEFREFSKGKIGQFTTMRVNDPARPFPVSFDMRGARVRTLRLMMLQRLQPRAVDGEPLDAVRLVSDRGSRAFVHVYRRFKGDLLSNPANRILLPPVAGSTVRAQLLAVPLKLRTKVFSSHGINDEALEADDAEAFITSRARELSRIEREHMGELGITPAEKEMGETDIDADPDDGN